MVWLDQVKRVPFDLILAHLESEIIIIRWFNYNPWRCGTIGELMLVLGSMMLLPVLAIPIIMLFICLIKLWIIFLSVVKTLVIVSDGWSGGIFTRSNEIFNFVMKLIHCMGLSGFGYQQLCYIFCCTCFCISKWHTWYCEVCWKSIVLITCSSLVLFIYILCQ